jgi:glycosyltransferase involved in cell wall biosynthesis
MTSRRDRVLVAVKGLGLGGAERLISEGARVWDRESFDYHVAYALPWKDQLVADLLSQEVPVHCVGRVGASSIPSAVGWRRLVGRIRPDLIHSHLPTMGIVARLTTKGPHVYTEHNLVGSYRWPTRVANRMTYQRNSAVIAVSQAVADSLAGHPGPSPEVIMNAVECRFDPTRAEAARIELGIDSAVPLVVHVGNIRPGKGHQTLIEASRLLKSEVGDILFVSIGGEKWNGDLHRMIDLARSAGVGGNVRFLGQREDALDFVSAADVYVNPADVEGLPVSLLEAMALGRPVVATAVGGVPGLVDHEKNGLLVPAKNPSKLAESIKRLLMDRRMAHELGQRARDHVERKHGLASMVRSIESVYRGVLSITKND